MSYLFLFLFVVIHLSVADYYNRTMLQKDYPGFGNDFIIFPDENGKEIIGYFKNTENRLLIPEVADEDVPEKVYFIYYSRNIPEGKIVKTPEELLNYVDKNKKIKFITHGWMSSSKSNVCVGMRLAYLNKFDINVIVMDWSEISGNLIYPIPMMATAPVAKYYSKFLNFIIDNMDIDPEDIHLIGHSLGAQISGFAGRRVEKGKVGRITGLDPALPGFSSGFENVDIGIVEGGHLNESDALFVDVIHTSAGFLGMKYPTGHADFYPNGGGPPQPGCDIIKFIEACSHRRSWQFFTKSILIKNAFMASKCSSFDALTNQKCIGDDIPMGEATPHDARGVYYVKTAAYDPFIFNWTFMENELDMND